MAGAVGYTLADPSAPSNSHTPGGYSIFRGQRRLEPEDGVHGYSENKDDYLNRLRRIEGQIRGLQRMIEEDKYCIDILTQVSAVTRALQSVALALLDEHLSHCVTQAVAEGGDTAAAKVREASDAIARLVRS
jgi:CsoR family transcriptional regulator, copper-sensing transcriptional repressor